METIELKLSEGLKDYSIIIENHKISFKYKYNTDSKEIILFIHGLACSGDSFRNLLDFDYFPNKSLLIIDLLGFGKSAKPEDFTYTMESQAKLIEELLLLLPELKIHIVAHSMGVAIALCLSPALISRFASFTNIEGNLIREDCGTLSRGIASVDFDYYKNELYERHLAEFKGHHQLRFEESTPLAIYKNSVSLVNWSDSGELIKIFENLPCRKSYFYGEENLGMPVLGKLGFVEKYMIHNSGHGLMTENPGEFYSKLVEFIGKD